VEELKNDKRNKGDENNMVFCRTNINVYGYSDPDRWLG
jgi:hypothetical protein